MSEAIDLFEHHEKQPDFLAAVTDYYCDKLEAEHDPAEVCREFLEAVRKVGYTFDYGLDCVPYGLVELEHRPESSLAANDFTDWMVKQLRSTVH